MIRHSFILDYIFVSTFEMFKFVLLLFNSFITESPESKREFEVWVEEKDYLEKNPDLIDASDHQLTIKWKNEKMGKPDERVTISIWAYQELDDTLYPQMIWILDLVSGIPNNGIHKLDLNQLPQFRLHRYDYHFGFIGVNKTGQELTATFWSNPIPLGNFIV